MKVVTILGLLFGLLSATSLPAQEQFVWHTLTVTFDQSELGDRPSTVIVTDSHHQVLLKRHDVRFLVPSMFRSPAEARKQFIRHLGRGPELLNLTTWSGGAYGAYQDTLFLYDPPRGLVTVWSRAEGRGRLGKSDGVGPALTRAVRRVEWSSSNLQRHALLRLDLRGDGPRLHVLVWISGRLFDIPNWRTHQGSPTLESDQRSLHARRV